MGTRGSVAWREADKVVGVYNHWDSYPSVLGEDVVSQVTEHGMSAVIEGLKQVGDWREYIGGGVCEYCGKTAGQPHSISAICLITPSDGPTSPKQKEVQANIEATGYPDPEAKWHSHGKGKLDHFDPFDDPLFMEWVYLLKPETNTIEVWHFAQCPKEVRDYCKQQGIAVSKPEVMRDKAPRRSPYALFLVEEVSPDTVYMARVEETAEEIKESLYAQINTGVDE